MNPEEYARMHALETDYWWFVGRRAIIATLLRKVSQTFLARHHPDRDNSTQAGGNARNTQSTPLLHLLDIGCGTGANLPMLCSVAGDLGYVIGVDFSPLALQFARDQLGGLPVTLLQGDALHLPFRDSSFDIVTMLDVLEHLSDDRRSLHEVRRVLRPGGAYVFSVPAYQHLWSAHDEALHHFRRYEMRDLRALLSANGFIPARLSFAMSLMPPAAWLWRKFILPFQPKRPKHASRHSEGAVLPQLPAGGNRMLIKYLEAEGHIIARRPLKFGTSIVGIAYRST
jgi:SAM-dependent methyltransferase